MISVPEVVIGGIAAATGGKGESLEDLALTAARKLRADRPSAAIGGVIAATFSNSRRFPALAVRVAAELGLPTDTPAFDLQLACSAYPYAVYLAGRLSADFGKPVLVLDGDVQSRLVDTADPATGGIFSDAVTASLVSSDPKGTPSRFDFLSRYDESLTCGETGPIRMDGFKVFTFVATEVSRFLRAFGDDFDWFAPHQANPYMIRQLAKSLGLAPKLQVLDESLKNPGSCSVPMTLAASGCRGRVLIAGFGAGLSASAGIVRVD